MLSVDIVLETLYEPSGWALKTRVTRSGWQGRLYIESPGKAITEQVDSTPRGGRQIILLSMVTSAPRFRSTEPSFSRPTNISDLFRLLRPSHSITATHVAAAGSFSSVFAVGVYGEYHGFM